MVKTKIIIAVIALACTSLLTAQDFHYKWIITDIDGTRTGVKPVVAKAEDALGKVVDSSFIAPNGSVYNGRTKDVASLLLSYQSKMARVKEVVAYSPKFLKKGYPESELTNLFVDLMMASVEKSSGKKVDVGLGNFGGVRVDLPKGDVILDDMLSMFPFKNSTVYLEIKGKDLRKIFETFASSSFQILGGVKIHVKDGVLVSALVGGEPIDDEKVYSMATIDFLYNGGDSVNIKSVAFNVQKYSVDVIDFVMDYVYELRKEGKPLTYHKDGRVVIEDTIPDKYLSIVHFNDTHSRFEAERAGENDGQGGIIERAAYIDSISTSVGDDNLILLHAGDFSQGSSYFTELNGDAEIDFINALGYDAVCLGNHEFDNGIEDLSRRLSSIEVPVLCANYDFSKTSLSEHIQPYTIIEKAGQKIGVIGLITHLGALVDVEALKDIKYKDIAKTANKYAKFLKKKMGCDLVICLTHLGFESENYNDIKLAKETKNVDIIVGGHSHTFLDKLVVEKNLEGKDVQIVTSGKWGLIAGELKVFLK